MMMTMMIMMMMMMMMMVMIIIMWTLPSEKVDYPLCKVYFTLAGVLSPLSRSTSPSVEVDHPLSGRPSPRWSTLPSEVDFPLVEGRLSPRVVTVAITMCMLRFILIASLGNVNE